MNFIERAIKVAKDRREQIEKENAEAEAAQKLRNESTAREKFRKAFEVDPDAVNGFVATLDGLSLVLNKWEGSGQFFWQIIVCECCDRKVFDDGVMSLFQLGEALLRLPEKHVCSWYCETCEIYSPEKQCSHKRTLLPLPGGSHDTAS
jgi:hypothetical protein